MSKSNSVKWDEIRKGGRRRFVLRYGVLGWGVSTGIFFSLWMGYCEGWDAFFFGLIPALVLFPLGGIAWGRFMWWFFERGHERVVGE
jgi:hypothetical protein